MISRPRKARRKQKPSAIDLFAGVGGLSLGAARAGFKLVGAIDSDPTAADTHAFNFPHTYHIESPVERLSGRDLLNTLGISPGRLHALIGGPPCQGFSEIGRMDRKDPRNTLFGHFFRLVAETRPIFFVAENVPGILASKYGNLRESAIERLPKCYEILEPRIVCASDLGAPTSRTRVFFIGADINRMPSLRGLSIQSQILGGVTVGKALAGLPAIRSDWQDDARSWRKVARIPKDTFFQRVGGLIPGDTGNEVALHYFRRHRLVSGCLGTIHSPSTIDRFKRLRSGEVDPVSRAVRLNPRGLCPTIRAGTGPEYGSYQAVRPIHPGSPRVITPREAARLQGFPDWFVFHPTKWHSFRQIGNSVSPIVGEAILKAIANLLPTSR